MGETQYYKKIKNKRIAIFGITPPPFGGVSVHIQRIAQKFKKNNNRVYYLRTEFRGRRFLLPFYLVYATLFLCIHKIDVIYYHSLSQPNSITELLFLVYIKKILQFKLILVEHNCQHMYKRTKKEKIKLNIIVKKIEEIIFMGDLPYKSYIKNNILPKKYTIDDAFIPPNIVSTTVENFRHIAQNIQNNTPILLMNTSGTYNPQHDVYGLDKAIKAIAEIKKTHPQIKLIIVSSIACPRLNKKVSADIKQMNLTNNITLIIQQKDLWPIIQMSDIFLRPTQCDGTSVSVREALFLGKLVVASNVCTRPKNTILFDSKNQDDFIQKIYSAISHILPCGQQTTKNNSKKKLCSQRFLEK